MNFLPAQNTGNIWLFSPIVNERICNVDHAFIGTYGSSKNHNFANHFNYPNHVK